MRIGVFIGDASGARTSVDELLAAARTAEARGLHDGLGAAHPLEPRRPHRARARGPGHPPDRARHRGDAHLPASPVGHGAAGVVDPGGHERPARARHRAVAPGGDRTDVRPRVPGAGAPHPRVRRGVTSCVRVHRQRRVPRRILRLLVDARRPGRVTRPGPRRRARATDAEAGGRGRRRHHHVLGERARTRRAHRAAHHPRRRSRWPIRSPCRRGPARRGVRRPRRGARTRRRASSPRTRAFPPING